MEKRNNIVTVIFSKDRPLQLDLTLITYEKYSDFRNIGNEFVIYRASNERFEKSYIQASKEHPNIKFIKETRFKTDLYECLKGNKYILFIVDDSIFTRNYSIKKICSYLDIGDGALGFSLRLGRNTTECYPLNIKNDIPEMVKFSEDVCAFNWKETKQGDFSYPLELSSSVYRVSDIKPIIEGIHYDNPNQLEWVMYNYIPFLVNRSFLFCYDISPAFSNPINKIQTENNNRVGTNPEYSIENLLMLYEKGYRIKHEDFDGFTSNGCHQEVNIDFVSLEGREHYNNKEYR